MDKKLNLPVLDAMFRDDYLKWERDKLKINGRIFGYEKIKYMKYLKIKYNLPRIPVFTSLPL